jgi:hypothetical protein
MAAKSIESDLTLEIAVNSSSSLLNLIPFTSFCRTRFVLQIPEYNLRLEAGVDERGSRGEVIGMMDSVREAVGEQKNE